MGENLLVSSSKRGLHIKLSAPILKSAGLLNKKHQDLRAQCGVPEITMHQGVRPISANET